MATQVQWRGGSTAEHATFTGAAREVTVDTQKQTLVLHDGSTAGGRPLLREDGSNAALALGSAGTPSLKFTGDLNTGIYSPGADQLAISTNGTGRLFVDASGNVGLGLSNPSYPLEVASAANSTINITGGTSNLCRLFFSDSTLARGFINYDHADDSVVIGTAGSERLRITSTGALGLGTSSPGYLLDIQSTSATLRIRNTTAPATGGTSSLLFEGINNFSGTSQSYISSIQAGNSGATQLAFGTSLSTDATATERLRITSAGLVGIGTTSPGAGLDVQAGTWSDGLIRVGTSTQAGRIGFRRGGDAVVTGYIGWNSATDDTTFNVSNGSGGGVTRLSAQDSVQFFTAITTPVERARIDSGGRLLVGTSTGRAAAGAQSSVQVETSNYIGFSVTNNTNDTGGGNIVLAKSRATSAGGVTIVQNNDNLGTLNFAGADGVDLDSVGATIAAFVDGTPGANDLPSRLVFSTTADGAASPTERMRINSNGAVGTFTVDGVTSLGVSTAATAGTATIAAAIRYGATAVYGGTISLQIYSNGNVQNTNNSYGAISDIKLKENIVDANSQWDDLKALQVRKYNFKEETGQQTHTQIGLVAQEAELVSPGLVSESPDRDAEGNDLGTVTKSVNYSVLYMKAVKALQEAMERIETLEAKVAALESV